MFIKYLYRLLYFVITSHQLEKYIYSQTFISFHQNSLQTKTLILPPLHRNIYKMVVSLNCLLLGDTFDGIFKVNVGNNFKDDNNVKIEISDFTVTDLKMLIQRTKKELKGSGSMNLWKVEIEDESKLKGVFTEKDIENKLNGKKMGSLTKFRAEDNFPASYEPPHDKVHIIVVPGKCPPMFYLSNNNLQYLILFLQFSTFSYIRKKFLYPSLRQRRRTNHG